MFHVPWMTHYRINPGVLNFNRYIDDKLIKCLLNTFSKLLNLNSLKSILVFINGQSSNQKSSLEKAFMYHTPVTLNHSLLKATPPLQSVLVLKHIKIIIF